MRRANGWQFFVATLLIIIGCVNIVQGFVALFTPEFYITTTADMLIFGYGFWGILLVLWGGLLAVIGLAVLSGQTWARALGIVLAAVNALAQLAFVMAMPVWSAFVIAIDILVIYGLSAGWSTAEAHHKRASQEDEGVYRSGHRAAHTAPRQASSPEQSGDRRETTG